MSVQEETIKTVPVAHLRMLRQQALRRAKRVFKEYPLICAILEGEYNSERQAIMEHVPPGIALHEVKTYNIADPVYQGFLALQRLEHKYRYHLRRYRAVNDVLALLDDETKKLVELCYFKNKTIAWVITHADEIGIYYAEITIKTRLRRAKELLAQRLGWWPLEEAYTFHVLSEVLRRSK